MFFSDIPPESEDILLESKEKKGAVTQRFSAK